MSACRWMLWLIVVAPWVHGGDFSLVTEIWVPDRWNPPEVVTQDGRTYVVPPTPAEMKREFVGSAVGVKAVSVHKKDNAKMPKLALRMSDSETLALTPGRDVKIGKDAFKLLARQDGFLYLQSRKSREVWRFKPAPVDEDKAAAKEDAKPKAEAKAPAGK